MTPADLLATSVPSLLLMAAAGLLVAIIIHRLLQNSFRGQTPPIFEGIPFIGGLLKFVQVRPLGGGRMCWWGPWGGRRMCR